MYLFIAFGIGLISFLAAYSTLDAVIAEKIRLYHICSEKNEQKKCRSKTEIITLSVITSACNIFATYRVLNTVADMINIIKILIMLICITGAAANDYREKRIPNIFSLVIAGTGMVCLMIRYIQNRDIFSAYLFSSIFATIVVAVCLVLGMVLTRGGIGLGDIKLLCAIALAGGVYVVGATIFCGIIICAVSSVILLAGKKKKMNDSIPFGPFIYIGFVIAIGMAIY